MADSLVLLRCKWKEPDLRDDVGVVGEWTSVGDVGVPKSLESLVRFFLRNPRLGIAARRVLALAAGGRGVQLLAVAGAQRAALGTRSGG